MRNISINLRKHTFIRYILHRHGHSSVPSTISKVRDLTKDLIHTSNPVFSVISFNLVSPSSELKSCLTCSLGISVSFEHRFGRSVVMDEEGRRAIWSCQVVSIVVGIG